MVELMTLGEIRLCTKGPVGNLALTSRPSLLQQTKPLALFVYLATNGRKSCSRHHLIEVFWRNGDAGRARNALSKTLSRIRTSLGEGVLVADARDIGIAPAAVQTDLNAFDTAAARDDVEAALALYRGDFLPGLALPESAAFEQWLDTMRVGLRRRATALARRRADRLLAQGDVPSAVATLERAVDWQPVDESLSCELIAALALSGDATRALLEFERVKQALDAHVGTTPSDATRALADRVRSRRPVPAPAEFVGANASASRAGDPEWPRALAILPFANLNGDPEQDYFADGMTEALITEFARRSPYRVISRQSVLGFRHTRQSLQEIAQALDVDTVIEGSVLRDGDRVRITAQLIRVQPEAHVWADTFDRTVSDVLALHADIANSIVLAIRTATARRDGAAHARDLHRYSPTLHEAEALTVDSAAYEAYLKGRHFSLRPPQMDRAIAHYHLAVERDPRYAPAWTGLASVCASLAMFAYLSPGEALPEMRRALERALALAPEQGEAIAVRGIYRMLADRDWNGARQDLLRGVEISPDSLDARIQLVVFLGAMGEFDAAFEHQRAAARVDPIGPATRFALAWCQYKAAQHRASIRELEAILELHPYFDLAYPYLAVNHALLGEHSPAQQAAREGLARLPNDHEALALAAAAFGQAGAVREGTDALDRLMALESDRYLDPWAVGVAYAGLRDFEPAVQWFRRMYDERSPSAFCVRHDPLLDPLRPHAGFRDIVRRLAFPPGPHPRA